MKIFEQKRGNNKERMKPVYVNSMIERLKLTIKNTKERRNRTAKK